jgi:AraC-like DNA-binding protein/mannose-6-phosphate isomerase-like protein (cupin superfamily)
MQNGFPKQFLSLDSSVNVRYSESPAESSISLHSHCFVEFSYLVEGRGTEIINQEAFEMRPGYFSIIYPWQTHELSFDGPIKYFFVSISMDNFLGAGSVALDLKDMFLAPGQNAPLGYYFTGEDADRLKRLFSELNAEFKERRKWWELSVKSRIMDILILFDRKCNIRREEPGAPAVSRARHQTMDIIFYIYNNFTDEISLSVLSRYFGLSQNYLSTLIKATIGLNFSDFLQNIRLKYACSLLASTSMPVTDIAYASGFQSYRNFERFFRKYYSMSPSHFRSTCSGPYGDAAASGS